MKPASFSQTIYSTFISCCCNKCKNSKGLSGENDGKDGNSMNNISSKNLLNTRKIARASI